jgi:hypothetical protein
VVQDCGILALKKITKMQETGPVLGWVSSGGGKVKERMKEEENMADVLCICV